MRILWIPHAGWHIPQRAHTFCRELASRHQMHVTHWDGDFRRLTDYVSLRYLKNFYYTTYVENNIRIHCIPRFSPAYFSSTLRKINQTIFVNHVDRLIKKYHIEVVVGTYLIPPPQNVRVVFDLFDENVSNWLSNPSTQSIAQEIEMVEAEYMQKASAIVAASTILYEKARRYNSTVPIKVIPNGVDMAQFREADGRMVRQQLGIDTSTRLIGTVANFELTEEVDLLIDIAHDLESQDIVMLLAGRGNALRYAKSRVKNENISNIIFRDFVPQSEVPNVIDALDVGLCPYRKTPMDDARSPMRLIVFSALGLPVVATDVAEIKRLDFPNVLTAEPTAKAFVEKILIALNMSRQQPSNIAEYDINHLVQNYETVLQGE